MSESVEGSDEVIYDNAGGNTTRPFPRRIVQRQRDSGHIELVEQIETIDGWEDEGCVATVEGDEVSLFVGSQALADLV